MHDVGNEFFKSLRGAGTGHVLKRWDVQMASLLAAGDLSKQNSLIVEGAGIGHVLKRWDVQRGGGEGSCQYS